MTRRMLWLALAAAVGGCATAPGNTGEPDRCAKCGRSIETAQTTVATAPASPRAACCHRTAAPSICDACAANK